MRGFRTRDVYLHLIPTNSTIIYIKTGIHIGKNTSISEIDSRRHNREIRQSAPELSVKANKSSLTYHTLNPILKVLPT